MASKAAKKKKKKKRQRPNKVVTESRNRGKPVKKRRKTYTSYGSDFFAEPDRTNAELHKFKRPTIKAQAHRRGYNRVKKLSSPPLRKRVLNEKKLHHAKGRNYHDPVTIPLATKEAERWNTHSTSRLSTTTSRRSVSTPLYQQDRRAGKNRLQRSTDRLGRGKKSKIRTSKSPVILTDSPSSTILVDEPNLENIDNMSLPSPKALRSRKKKSSVDITETSPSPKFVRSRKKSRVDETDPLLSPSPKKASRTSRKKSRRTYGRSDKYMPG